MANPSDITPFENSNKVPEITLTFWLIKILSTTVGETCADYLAVNVGLGTLLTDLITTTLLAAALSLQMRSKTYIPWTYWLTVVLVSIVGTQITDALTDTASVSLYASTAAFSVLLAATFWFWHRAEGTLSINTIDSRTRESYYWAAILCTFALGTAAGDLATEALGWGFSIGVLNFSAMIAVTVVAARLGLNRMLAVWIAYILTRPLGASLGDLLSQPRKYGGLGLGTIYTSAIFLTVIVVLVAYLTAQKAQARASQTV